MKFLRQNYQKESWQIAAARYCVVNAEKGFSESGLQKYIKSLYAVDERHIRQFYKEEICKPAGREYARDFISTEKGGVWTPPLDLVSKITDYDELQEARKNARQAFWLSIIAIIISTVTLYTSLKLGENQIESSQGQIQLQSAIWGYEQMRNDRLENRDIQWRLEDLQFQGRLPN